MQHVWGYRQSKNVLSTDNLRRARDALKSGQIFGYWYRPHSGGGPSYWLASDFSEFEGVIADGRAVDYHVVWSLPALVAQGMALAAARYDDLPQDPTSLFTPEDKAAIEAHLSDQAQEVFALFFGTSRGMEIFVTDHDGLDYVAENAEWYCKPGGEGYVFPFTSDRRDTSGHLLNTIERPEYWLLDGWYPDELGRVPTEVEHG
jgi:hypothetical protein